MLPRLTLANHPGKLHICAARQSRFISIGVQKLRIRPVRRVKSTGD